MMTALDIAAIAWTLLALALVLIQFRITAPHGRHARSDWGPLIPNRLGWFLMELVSLVVPDYPRNRRAVIPGLI